MKTNTLITIVTAAGVITLAAPPSRAVDLGDITMGGVLEAEMTAGSDQGEDVSDIVLATFELGIDAEVTEGVSASAVLLWEEDDTEPIDLDVGIITLGGTDAMPIVLEIGKLYIPFGVFNSYFVSDPITVDLAETRESGALVSYGTDRFGITVGAFNGDLDEAGDDNHVDDFVVAITLDPADAIELGAYWVSDMGEGGLEEGLAAATEATGETPGVDYEEVGGAGAYASFVIGPIMIEGEYITALDAFNAGLLGESELEPMAWNLELAFAATDVLELAARIEGSEDMPDMPESQFGFAAGYAISDNVTLGLEYLHGSYEGDIEDRDMATAQVAVEF